MHEPTVSTDDGIRQWAEEQKRYVEAIPRGDPRSRYAALILSNVDDILAELAHADSADACKRTEKRKLEILRDLHEEWRQFKPTIAPPVRELNGKAERQAYRETRAGIMRLVERIIDLRKLAEAPLVKR